MKPKDPGTVVDEATARNSAAKADNREPIELDLKGAVASVIVQLVTQATAQAIQSDGARIAVSAFLEAERRHVPSLKADDPWKVHVTAMEFDPESQSLRIKGLELRPVK